ncbi:chaperone protein DnaJ [Arthrobacter sp. Hiyo4]|nr:chaperone protein DnaJ [Arthrobacter sp. Hiyo4]
MTTQPDYYDVLRVRPSASQQEISRAYRALMRTHHPDLDGGATGGATPGRDLSRAELLQIMQAFSVLRDPVRRAAYDRSGLGINAHGAGPVVIPVRNIKRRDEQAGNTIRITPVRWESGPWT